MISNYNIITYLQLPKVPTNCNQDYNCLLASAPKIEKKWLKATFKKIHCLKGRASPLKVHVQPLR